MFSFLSSSVFKEQIAYLPEYFSAHLWITLVSLALGLFFALPLGIWVSQKKHLAPLVLGLAGIIQTIPSLALLAIMVPILAFFESWSGIPIPSIGALPAVVALTLYSMLPILRNTVTGLAGTDKSVLEAADAVGMTKFQRLCRIELPLALPVIVAGLRTSTVWVVGTATLSTPIGATSLGNFIFSGLQTRNFTAVGIGCVSAAILALSLDGLIRWQEAQLRSRSKTGRVAIGFIVLGLVFWLSSTLWNLNFNSRQPIRVGTKAFTEQYILGELVEQWIEADTGRNVVQVSSLGSTVAFDALKEDQIDLYVDYTGTIWATIMGREDSPGRKKIFQEVRNYLHKQHGIHLVSSLGFENSYALAMRSDKSKELRIKNISDLSLFSPMMVIGADIEFFSRTEWKSLVSVYSLKFRERRSMDPGLMYQAVQLRDVDVVSAFSTDARIDAYDLVILNDDKSAIPPYDAVLLASPGVIKREPNLLEDLSALSGRLTASSMRAANLEVDLKSRTPKKVAHDWLLRLR